MFNSLEVRSPFLDREFAEYAGSLPTRFKLAGSKRKIVLKRLAGRYLPEAVVNRKKHGFAVPIGALIRTLFWERCADLLLSRTNPAAEWFERSTIETLLCEHRAGRRDHGKKLWALYVLFRVALLRHAPPAATPYTAEAVQ
jgi:asparagine synthase (glutamine-hydrolysing)